MSSNVTIDPGKSLSPRADLTRGPSRWARRAVNSREEFSLQALIELAEDIVGVPDPYRVAELSLMNLMGVVGSPLAAMWAISEDHEPIRLRRFGFSDEAMELVETEALPILRDDIDPEGAIPIVVSESGVVLGEALQKALLEHRIEVVSLFKVQDQPSAIMIIGAPYNGDYESFQLKSLETALCYVSAALENSRLQAQLTERNRKLRHMSERVKDLDRLKQQFINNLTHELRTPLSVIVGCVDIAMDDPKLPSDSREMLRAAAEATGTLDSLILRLLDFREAQLNSLEMSVKRVTLTAFLKDYYRNRIPGVSGDLREFVLERSKDPIDGLVDEWRLSQAMDALVDNAVKFTPRGARIVLALKRGEYQGARHAIITLTDDGPGIPVEMQEKIFESFRQLDGSATRPVGGLGLGLPFARELVKAMGGNIRIESEVGRGTTCQVILPLANAR